MDLTICEGERLVILGPNGSGKSSLIKTMMGEHRHDTSVPGSIRQAKRIGHSGTSSTCARPSDWCPLDLQVDLSRDMDCLEVVLSGFFGSVGTNRSQDIGPEMEKLAMNALTAVGSTHLAARRYYTLSTGEARRVLMARALVNSPEALILDEPMNSLDLTGKRAGSVGYSVGGQGRAVALVLVTHDPGGHRAGDGRGGDGRGRHGYSRDGGLRAAPTRRTFPLLYDGSGRPALGWTAGTVAWPEGYVKGGGGAALRWHQVVPATHYWSGLLRASAGRTGPARLSTASTGKMCDPRHPWLPWPDASRSAPCTRAMAFTVTAMVRKKPKNSSTRGYPFSGRRRQQEQGDESHGNAVFRGPGTAQSRKRWANRCKNRRSGLR
ncbi:MAG: ATP-binding cassette domain-containing protein [Desulfobacterales bacterium]|nr:ATP-binding cassette domain-containing protein [Desulfobacterales bacterium]